MQQDTIATRFTIDEALSRGRRVVDQQHTRLEQLLTPGIKYYLIEDANRLVGCQLEQVFPRTDDDKLPLHGRIHMAKQSGARQLQIDQTWRCAADASRFQINIKWRIRDPEWSGGDQQVTEQLQLHNGQLTLKQIEPAPVIEKWSVDAPQSFVFPIIEEAWPIAGVNEWQEGPLLVWLTHGRVRPRPYWIRKRMIQSDTLIDVAPDNLTNTHLFVRPMMSLGADLLTYNDRHELIQYRSTRPTGPSSGSAMTIRRVGLDEMIEALPSLEPMINEWLKPTHAQ